MTKNEAAVIMAILRVAFPAFYRNSTEADAKASINLWYDMFKDDPAELVEAAVKSIIATKIEGYPPTIGAVKEKIREIQNPNAMTAQDAWAIVSKAAAGNMQWEDLPRSIQKAIGSPSVLHNWRMMEEDSFNSVVYSNFIKSYKVIEEREIANAKLPSSVLKAIGETRLLEGKEN